MIKNSDVNKILSKFFGLNLNSKKNYHRDDIENWDSIAHVELIFFLEDYYKVSFTERQMIKLNSTDKILKELNKIKKF